MSDRRRISTIFTLLETAISNGNHYEAADLSKELAGLKIPCSVTKTEPTTPDKSSRRHSSVISEENYPSYRSNNNSFYCDDTTEDYETLEYQHDIPPLISRQKSIDISRRRQIKSEIIQNGLYSTSNTHHTIFNVQLFVEDRTSHQGPINVSVDSRMTVGQLRMKVHENFGFPPEVQRWILGRRLADNDEETLSFYHITKEGCPIFLYLVAPDHGKMFSIHKPVDVSNLKTFSNDSMGIWKNVEKHEQFTIPCKSLRFESEEIYVMGSSEETSDDEKVKNILFHDKTEFVDNYNKTESYSGSKVIDEKSRLKYIKQEQKSNHKNNKSTRSASLPDNIISDTFMDIPMQASCNVSKFKDIMKLKNIQKTNPISHFEEENPIAHADQKPSTSKDVNDIMKLRNIREINSISNAEGKKSSVKFNQNPSTSGDPNDIMKLRNNTQEIDPISNADEEKPNAKIHQKPSTSRETLQNHAPESPEVTWQCSQCTLENPVARPGCEACSAAKPQHNKQVLPLESLDKIDLVLCTDEFECSVCYTTVEMGKGIVLRECLHTFCRECLRDTARYSDSAGVACPYRDEQYSCPATLQDREVKALVNAKDFDKHLDKSVTQAAGTMQNVFHCKTPDCRGFCVFEDNVNVFLCNVCFRQNCLTCQAQHTELSCKQYQDMLASQEDLDSLKTKKFFEDMVARGDGLGCPGCSVMLVRKWGCDWMKCPMCRTEICWVTGKPRWGPAGPGDTTGGCQCGLYGRKCHPKCTYCH